MVRDTTSSYDKISTKELKKRGCFDVNMFNKQTTINREFNDRRQLRIIIGSVVCNEHPYIEIAFIRDDYE